MSKEKPEVGDVWEFRGVSDYVLEVDDTTVRICFLHNGKRLITVNYLTKEYTKAAKYLGKGKVNLEELFEVKEESNDR